MGRLQYRRELCNSKAAICNGRDSVYQYVRAISKTDSARGRPPRTNPLIITRSKETAGGKGGERRRKLEGKEEIKKRPIRKYKKSSYIYSNINDFF